MYRYYVAVIFDSLCHKGFLPFQVLDFATLMQTGHQPGGEVDELRVRSVGLRELTRRVPSLSSELINRDKHPA